ncbi:MAG: DUF4435 domain-containing protein [Paludibacteraceae bacterium]|nr:DUF4435 domain-containing protein [Paludibacteraceae bacterium]
MVWVVVEAEEDVAVYEKFVLVDSTIVKTSVDETGRMGYANVQTIVRDIKKEDPKAHIIGIRDADYALYNDKYVVPENIFLTDHRDVEMMLLEAESVKQALRAWMPSYDEVFARCIPICRYFGYLRIYNELANLSVRFHDNLSPNKYWDYQKQAMKVGWEQDSTTQFAVLSNGKCVEEDVKAFIITHKLEEESLYDVCRGHDMLKLLSLNLIDVQTYSTPCIMTKITDAYSLSDFKATRLYKSIFNWQIAEGVIALL